MSILNKEKMNNGDDVIMIRFRRDADVGYFFSFENERNIHHIHKGGVVGLYIYIMSMVENISPGFWKKNAFLLGDTFLKMKNVAEAKLWLEKAKHIPIKTTEDSEVQAQIETLLLTL